jgi:Putative adhesin
MQHHRFAIAALLAGVAFSLGGCRREARERADAFSWSDELAPGTTVHLRTMNGTVAVHGTPEPRLQVQGLKRWRHGRERDVRFVTSRDGDDVYLCAIWVRRGGRCGEERYGPRPPRFLALFSLFNRRTDMSASFDVMLPPGVAVDASTVNGRVTVMDADGDVEAQTVNGDIRASTNGGALALSTVNGSIHARTASLPNDAEVRLKTVNGSVRAELPASVDADVRLSTVNGRITTDFPLEITGKTSSRDLRGTVGGGGRTVELKTVNGSVELKRESAGSP